jgi:hypothetical protein
MIPKCWIFSPLLKTLLANDISSGMPPAMSRRVPVIPVLPFTKHPMKGQYTQYRHSNEVSARIRPFDSFACKVLGMSPQKEMHVI